MGLEYMDWTDLAVDSNMCQTLVNAKMNLQIPETAGNFLTSRGTVSS